MQVEKFQRVLRCLPAALLGPAQATGLAGGSDYIPKKGKVKFV